MSAASATATPDTATPDTDAPDTATLPVPVDLRSAILAADDITTEIVPVPEWHLQVAVRTMTGLARANMLQSAADPDTGIINYKSLYPQVIIATCVHPTTGESLFTPADVDLLNQKSSAAIERVAQAGMRISGMNQEAEKELGNASSEESAGSTSN